VTLPSLWIATTRGPIEIVSITEEDPEIRSVLCLSDSFQELPISPLYDAFVRRPTGIIEQITGHSSYRVDLSGPIMQGHSWQLGLAMTHLFHAEVQKNSFSLPNALIWTTGKVTPRGMVQPVGEIAQKWEMTIAELAKAAAKPDKIIVVAHAANVAELKKLEQTSDAHPPITYLPVASLNDITAYFDLSIDSALSAPATKSPSIKKRYLVFALFVFVAIASVVKIAADFVLPLSRLDAEGRYRELFMELRLMRQEGNWFDVNGAFFFQKHLENRAARLRHNMHVEIRSVRSVNTTCVSHKATITTSTLPDWVHEACQLQLVLGNRSNHPIGIWIALVSHGTTGTPTVILRNHAALPPNQTVTLPEFIMERSNEIKTVIAIASIMPDSELLPWFNALINDIHPADHMIRRIEKSGSGFLFAQAIRAQK
jgi:hypothetical protein